MLSFDGLYSTWESFDGIGTAWDSVGRVASTLYGASANARNCKPARESSADSSLAGLQFGMDPTPQSLTYATLPTLSHAPGNSLATPHECGRYVMLLLRQFAACGVDGGISQGSGGVRNIRPAMLVPGEESADDSPGDLHPVD